MIFRKPTSGGLLISHEGQPPASRAEAAVRTGNVRGRVIRAMARNVNPKRQQSVGIFYTLVTVNSVRFASYLILWMFAVQERILLSFPLTASSVHAGD